MQADVYLISSLLPYSSLDLHILIRFKKLSIGHRNPAIFYPGSHYEAYVYMKKQKHFTSKTFGTNSLNHICWESHLKKLHQFSEKFKNDCLAKL